MQIEWLLSGTERKWDERNYRSGGYIYEYYVRKVLKNDHTIDVKYLFRGNHKSRIIRIFQFIRYILKNFTLKLQGEVVIRDVFSTIFAPFDKKRQNITILHHIDISNVKYKRLYKLLKKRFFNRLRKSDRVIVVSEFWKNILESAGLSNVSIIYNSFDLDLFKFDQYELADFKKRIGINENQPIIYLGNARPDKGFIQSYSVLKDTNATFVITGRNKTSLPILQYYLSYSDYLKLLKISSLTITMSKFDEGWCRTSHEAMLCETAVIGSGRGGMRELLEKGGQVVCNDLHKLRSLVSDLLNNQKKLNELSLLGKKFACQFSLDYFKDKWLNLILSLENKED